MVRLGGNECTCRNIECKVSIPVWCDWEGGFRIFVIFLFVEFQFQYGAIGRYGAWSELWAGFVSIPVWCDWEPTCYTFAEFLKSFNSSMVRLGVRQHRNKTPCHRKFQFQYGAIGSFFPFFNQCIEAKFQFQYGAIGRINHRTIG